MIIQVILDEDGPHKPSWPHYGSSVTVPNHGRMVSKITVCHSFSLNLHLSLRIIQFNGLEKIIIYYLAFFLQIDYLYK